MPNHFIEQIKRQIAQYQSMLEPLESGKLRIGEARNGQPWADRTQAQIDHLKGIIGMLQTETLPAICHSTRRLGEF